MKCYWCGTWVSINNFITGYCDGKYRRFHTHCWGDKLQNRPKPTKQTRKQIYKEVK